MLRSFLLCVLVASASGVATDEFGIRAKNTHASMMVTAEGNVKDMAAVRGSLIRAEGKAAVEQVKESDEPAEDSEDDTDMEVQKIEPAAGGAEQVEVSEDEGEEDGDAAMDALIQQTDNADKDSDDAEDEYNDADAMDDVESTLDDASLVEAAEARTEADSDVESGSDSIIVKSNFTDVPDFGAIRAPKSPNECSTTFKNVLSRDNGWRDYGGSYGKVTWTIRNDLCIVSGLMRAGDWNKRMAHLDARCRPGKRLVFNMNNHQSSSRIDVLTNGAIQWKGGQRSHGWVSLAGMSFLSVTDRLKPPASFASKTGVIKLGAGNIPWAHNDYGQPTWTVRDERCILEGVVHARGHPHHIARLPGACRPRQQLIFNMYVTTNPDRNGGSPGRHPARVDILTNGLIQKHSGPGNSFLSLTGMTFSTTRGAMNKVQMINGWRSYGGSYGTVHYKVNDLFCTVEGLARGNRWGRMAQLPPACRPAKRLIFNQNNYQHDSRIDVTPDGVIQWSGGHRSHGWVSLTGIQIPTCWPDSVQALVQVNSSVEA